MYEYIITSKDNINTTVFTGQHRESGVDALNLAHKIAEFWRSDCAVVDTDTGEVVALVRHKPWLYYSSPFRYFDCHEVNIMGFYKCDRYLRPNRHQRKNDRRLDAIYDYAFSEQGWLEYGELNGFVLPQDSDYH